MILLALALGSGIYISGLFTRKPAKFVQKGKVFVSGTGEAFINLYSKEEPKYVRAHFCDEFKHHPSHPCNPYQDRFDWELIRDTQGFYKLVLSYSVSSIREISYRVKY